MCTHSTAPIPREGFGRVLSGPQGAAWSPRTVSLFGLRKRYASTPARSHVMILARSDDE